MAQQQASQTVKSTRIPLIGSYTNRSSSTSKDQRFVNVFPETKKVEQLDNTKIFLQKRGGLVSYRDFGTGEGRGVIHFNDKFYVAVGNTVYEDAVSPVSKITLNGSTGPLGMCLGNSTTIGDYLFICDGTSGWVIDTTGTVTEIDPTSIRSITITSGGAGYGSVPTVSFSGGGGTGAAATATVSGGVVTAITLTNYGTDYTAAPTVTITAPVTTIDPSTAVNTTDDTISITNYYATGSAVVYSNGGGTNIGGLTSGTTYYVIAVDSTKFKLATSSALAEAGTAINLTSTGTGTTHTFTGTATATATASLNAFPNPHIPTPIYIDGYIMLPQRSDIYNCVLDEPGQWDASNYITAEMFPDAIVGLTKQNNQVVALGEHSIEFFFDAANPTGSPLSRNDSTVIQMGCASAYTVVATEKFFSYISESGVGGRAIWVVEGFNPRKVSDEFIERILNAETDIESSRAFGVRTDGHFFYVFNLKTLGRSLVYDPDEKLWHEWSSNNAGSHQIFQCDFSSDNHTGVPYLLHVSNGKLYQMDTGTYQDDGVGILVDIVTSKYDFDSYKRKFISNIKIVGDQYATGNAVELRWSDDDYQSWSNTKTISMADGFPAFHRLGATRRRAFNLKHSLNYPLRLESLEVDYSLGVS